MSVVILIGIGMFVAGLYNRLVGRAKLPDVVAELSDVLAIVAKYGHDNAVAAHRAYVLGLQEVLPGVPATRYAPPGEWALALDQALPKLDLLAPA